MKRGFWTIIVSFSLLFAFDVAALLAGGPLRVSGNGTPARWSVDEPVLWNPDQGGLGKLSNAEAVQIVVDSFQAWADIETAALTFQQGDPLPSDVTAQNYRRFFRCGDRLTPVVFDEDGSIFEDIYGQGSAQLILGFASPSCIDGDTIVEGVAFINGMAIDGDFGNGESTHDDLVLTIIHELGHMLGLAHSQVNGTAYSLYRGIKGFETFGVPPVESVEIMYPVALPGDRLRAPVADDRAWFSWLYPAESFSQMGSIEGTVFESDGTTKLQGANVVARNLENPIMDAVSSVSGFQPNDKGHYFIPGLTAGKDHVVYTEEIWEIYTGGSGIPPLDPPADISPVSEFAFLEYYNGENEGGSEPGDDPLERTPVPTTAGEPTTGIDFWMNFSDTVDQGSCEGVNFPAVSLDDLPDDPAIAVGNFFTHNLSSITDQGAQFTPDPEGIIHGAMRFRDEQRTFTPETDEVSGIDDRGDPGTDDDVVRIYWGDLSNQGETLEIILFPETEEIEAGVPIGLGSAVGSGVGVLFSDYANRTPETIFGSIGGEMIPFCTNRVAGAEGFSGGTYKMYLPSRDLPTIDPGSVASNTMKGNFETIVVHFGFTTFFGNGNAFGKLGNRNLNLNPDDQNFISAISFPFGPGVQFLIANFTGNAQAQRAPLILVTMQDGEAITPGAEIPIDRQSVALVGWEKFSDFSNGADPDFEGCSGTVRIYPETTGTQINQRFTGEFDAKIAAIGRCAEQPECTVDDDCADGEICEENRCVTAECTVDDDCADGEICDAGRCIPDGGGTTAPAETVETVESSTGGAETTAETGGEGTEGTSGGEMVTETPAGTAAATDSGDNGGGGCGCVTVAGTPQDPSGLPFFFGIGLLFFLGMRRHFRHRG